MAHVEDYAHEGNSVAKILITPDERSSDLDQHLTSIQRQLALIKRDLEILHEQIPADEIGSETQAKKTMESIKHLLRLAMETEMKILSSILLSHLHLLTKIWFPIVFLQALV